MKIKKIIWVFFLVILVNRVSAQMDSTDLNLSTTEFVLETSDDSVMYGSGDYLQMQLDFEIDDLPNFGKIWIEVVNFNLEGQQTTVYYKSFTHTQLTELDLIDENAVHLELAVALPSHSYQVFLRIEDLVGHEKIFISKYFAE